MSSPQCSLSAIVAIALIAVSDALPPQRIVGGQKAVPGEFPYQVSLRVNGSHHCGGSIITNRHVVTAHHCVGDKLLKKSLDNLLIVTGSVKADEGQTHTVKSVHYYNDYKSNSNTSYDDIIIVELNENIIFNDNQTSVALPDESPSSGVTANVTGWGYTNENERVPTNDLMKLTVTTLTSEESQQQYFKEHVIDFYPNNIYAIGAPGTGVCYRDSGGGLVRNGKLIGLVSSGIPCAKGYPDVYINVYYYIDWIRHIISRK